MNAKEMAEYILQCLKKPNLAVFWSWGCDPKYYQIYDKDNVRGLRFKANGALHKGWVRIEYNPIDYFEVVLESNGKIKSVGKEKTRIKDVDCFSLQDVVDRLVETK